MSNKKVFPGTYRLGIARIYNQQGNLVSITNFAYIMDEERKNCDTELGVTEDDLDAWMNEGCGMQIPEVQLIQDPVDGSILGLMLTGHHKRFSDTSGSFAEIELLPITGKLYPSSTIINSAGKIDYDWTNKHRTANAIEKYKAEQMRYI